MLFYNNWKHLERIIEKALHLVLILRFYFYFTLNSVSRLLLVLLFPTAKCLTCFIIRHKYNVINCDVHTNNYFFKKCIKCDQLTEFFTKCRQLHNQHPHHKAKHDQPHSGPLTALAIVNSSFPKDTATLTSNTMA